MRSGGFTYLEILAVLIILTVMIVPVMQLMPGAMTVVTELDRIEKAGFLAQYKMDETRNRILGTNPSYGFAANYNTSATAFPSPDDGYKCTITDSQGLNIKNLNVTAWFDEDNDGTLDANEKYVSLDTRVANKGTWRT